MRVGGDRAEVPVNPQCGSRLDPERVREPRVREHHGDGEHHDCDPHPPEPKAHEEDQRIHQIQIFLARERPEVRKQMMGEEHWLGPLESGANRSGTVLVGVVDAPGRAFAHASSLSVGFSRTDWIWERGQLVGLRALAHCVKNRVAPPLGETELEIRYPLGAQTLFDHKVHVAEVPLHVERLETQCQASAVV